ncbi:MAG: NAD(P)/FAD-dependent oxidoreductase [Methanobacteriaceae archaeon]|nr:NAD(P)/FAD-dependent oxidoreductase [Methanobacteriaceae archaeon]
MEIYDVAVVGGGAAGCMAAIQARFSDKKVVLLERNPEIGRKILITGNGRCNLTNNSPTPVFIRKFGRRGSFYRSAFLSFTSADLVKFFMEAGLKLKEEDKGRIFPISDRSQSVIDILRAQLKKRKVQVLCNYRVKELKKQDGYFQLSKEVEGKNGNKHHKKHPPDDSIKNDPSNESEIIRASRVILSTGGASYPQTGSSGDGYQLAENLNHTITPLKPGLVPLTIKERWPIAMQGLILKEVALTVKHGKKGKIKVAGDLLFTHFGVSGPTLLDLSQEIVKILDKEGEVKLFVDLMPQRTREQIEEKLLYDFKKYSKRDIQNYLRFHLPPGFIKALLEFLDIDQHKKLNQIGRQERIKLLDNIKSLKLTVDGYMPLSKAMVTCGGISKKEIDPQTMESRLVQGLYLAGEIITGCAPSGGYNLQQAFSTGFLAGRSASYSINENLH